MSSQEAAANASQTLSKHKAMLEQLSTGAKQEVAEVRIMRATMAAAAETHSNELATLTMTESAQLQVGTASHDSSAHVLVFAL